ncbi:MAG: PDZ domain-containing protein [Bacteroidota bacterium]
MNKRFVAAVLLMLTAFVGATYAGPTDDASQKEKPQKGWLGVQIQDITPQLKRTMELSTREGALVSEVVDESPADSAGIKEKDIIVQFDGKDIGDTEDLQNAVSATKPGTKVSVVVVRKGEKKTLQVTIGKYPRSRSFAVVAPKAPGRIEIFGAEYSWQGLNLRPLNEQLAQYFDAPEGKGVLVWEVEKNSAADKAGFKAGDVITQVGKKRIDEVRDVSRALGAFDEGEKVEVEIIRKGARKTLSLEVEENEDSRGFNFFFREPRLKSQREFYFDVPEIKIDVPHIEMDRIRPDLDVLRLELDRIKDQIHEETGRLKRELRLQVKPHIQIRMRREV